jgi:hypothetical protein
LSEQLLAEIRRFAAHELRRWWSAASWRSLPLSAGGWRGSILFLVAGIANDGCRKIAFTRIFDEAGRDGNAQDHRHAVWAGMVVSLLLAIYGLDVSIGFV